MDAVAARGAEAQAWWDSPGGRAAAQPRAPRGRPGGADEPPGAVATARLQTPASFKAGKPRKTKGLISALEQTPCGDQAHEHLDDRLVCDADSVEISARVAALISRYVQEGDAKAPAQPRDAGEDEFHDSRFLRARCCLLRCVACPGAGRRRQPLEPDVVCRMISEVAAALYFCKQVVVLCAVYVERLMRRTGVTLTTDNWRSVVVAALLIASKVWEDIHPWNADFEACINDVIGMRYRAGALYDLESVFLRKLKWEVHVDGEEYAAYFFSLLEGPRLCAGTDAHAFRPSSRMATLAEEDIHCGSDSDVERGVLPMDAPPEPSPRHHSFDGGRRASCSSRERRPSSSSGGSAPPSPLPWSREDLAAMWRRAILQDDHGEAEGFKLRAIRDTWRLDSHNPHVGALRHAPRALAPSQRIPQSEALLCAHALALQTADVLGPSSLRRLGAGSQGAAHTLTGATGDQLASELRQYLRPVAEGDVCAESPRRGGPAERLLDEEPEGYVGVSFGAS